jgi:uncharacterized membrane protein YkvA (DUF1232 family)
MFQNLRAWARRIKRDGVTLWFACRDPRTPLAPKMLAFFVVAYALSPIDLVPDFIPILGYVDDVLLLPALIWLAIRLIPPAVLADNRQRAEAWMRASNARLRSKVGAAVIIAIWLLVGVWAFHWLFRGQ